MGPKRRAEPLLVQSGERRAGNWELQPANSMWKTRNSVSWGMTNHLLRVMETPGRFLTVVPACFQADWAPALFECCFVKKEPAHRYHGKSLRSLGGSLVCELVATLPGTLFSVHPSVRFLGIWSGTGDRSKTPHLVTH